MYTETEFAIAVVILSVIVAATEALGLYNIAYSKFRYAAPSALMNFGTLNSRLGMFLLYFGPIVAMFVSVDYFFEHQGLQVVRSNVYVAVFLGFVLVQFTKRCLESLFVHKYSGPIPVISVLEITASYVTVVVVYVWSLAKNYKVNSKTTSDEYIMFCCFVMAVGLLGNGYHHLLLANLRPTSGSKQYKIPEGGFFGLVACPHYLFELIGWAGASLLLNTPLSYAAFSVFLGYLGARSYLTLKWNRKQFDNYPKNRKCLIPFIF